MPLFTELGYTLHHGQRCAASSNSMVPLLERRAPKSHYRIADVFVERAFGLKNDSSHIGQISIQQKRQVLRVKFLGDRSEIPDIAKHNGDFGLARLHQLRMLEQSANDLWTQILLEAAAHFAFFPLLDDDTVESDETYV